MAREANYPNALRALIKLNGYTIQEVAEETNIPLRTLFEYCAGRAPIPRKRLEQLAATIGCSIDEIRASAPSARYIQQQREAARQVEMAGALHQNATSLAASERVDISRRQMLALLAGVPFGLAQVEHLLHEEEVLSLYAANIPICWRLYFDGGMLELKHIIPQYLAHLSLLMEQSSRQHKRAASLASQAHQLASLLALQDRQFERALTHARQAFQAGQIAEDQELQAASLIREGLVYFYLNQPEPMLQIFQKAEQYHQHISPLLQFRVAAGLAKGYSSRQEKQPALTALGIAHDTFPERPQDDPNFAYTHFNKFSLFGYDSKVHLDLGQPRQAWEPLAAIDGSISTALVPERVELSLCQATVAVALKDLDLSGAYLKTTVDSALALGSELRYQEARTLYAQMRRIWPRERRVKALRELF